MGIHEWFEPVIGPGPAPVEGPVTCTVPSTAQATTASGATHRLTSRVPAWGPTAKVILDTDGNGSVPSGQAGAGTWHLGSCYLYGGPFPDTGNTGAGNTGTN